MELGVVLPTMSRKDSVPGDVAAAARHAEELGFESVWAVDQLIAGTGIPLLDSLTSLAAAAAVTHRVYLATGVLIVPLRPVVWIAKQVASLQYLSGGRVLLGIGAGGDRHGASWAAAGTQRRERGRRTDEALRVLPALIAGQPARLAPDGEDVVLSPGVKVPPIILGGMSEAAVERVAAHGDDWFVLAEPEDIPRYQQLAAERAFGHGRPAPAITVSVMAAMDGDPQLPGIDTIARMVSDPDGKFGLPEEHARRAVQAGGPEAIAEHLAHIAARGARRTVVTFVGGDWFRQAELLAAAWSRVPQT